MGAPQSKTQKIRILLADDHPLIRQVLREILERQIDFEVVGEASDGEEAINLCELMPDVVIMDISMPKVNGLQATREIKARHPGIAILVLTVHDDDEHILHLLESGAAGYLIKTVFEEEVIHAVRSVVARETVLSPSVSKKLIRHAAWYLAKPVQLIPAGNITSHEMRVLKLAARGLRNKIIAQELNISERTVKAYLEQIFSKLNVASRTEAVIAALQMGILTLDELG